MVLKASKISNFSAQRNDRGKRKSVTRNSGAYRTKGLQIIEAQADWCACRMIYIARGLVRHSAITPPRSMRSKPDSRRKRVNMYNQNINMILERQDRSSCCTKFSFPSCYQPH